MKHLRCSKEAKGSFWRECFNQRIDLLAGVAEAAQQMVDTQDRMPGNDLGAAAMADCWIALRAALKKVATYPL